jgi:hypothetical protein
MHLDALGEELAVPNQLLGVDIDEFLPWTLEDGRVEAENRVVINGCLDLEKLLVLLWAAVYDMA